MTVNTNTFRKRVIERLQSKCNAVASTHSHAAYEKMCRIFNARIEGENDGKIDVVAMPTGTGKTQGVIVYAQMLAHMNSAPTFAKDTLNLQPDRLHPGILIVVRERVDADDIAAQINEGLNKPSAYARHGDSPLADPSTAPVLIVTHQAYRQALMQKNSDIPFEWERIHAWSQSGRSLTIIDEKMSPFDVQQVTGTEVRRATGLLEQEYNVECPEAVQFLESLCTSIDHWQSSHDHAHQHFVSGLWNDSPDFSPLCKRLGQSRFDELVLERRDNADNNLIKSTITKTIAKVEAFSGQDVLVSKTGNEVKITKTTKLFDEGFVGAVMLDATACIDTEYLLMPELFSIAQVNRNVRDYRNVTLCPSYVGRTGKSTLSEHDAHSFMCSVFKDKDPEADLLVACHKLNRPKFERMDNFEKGFELAHFNNMDGKNNWNNVQDIALFGLPHRDEIWPLAVYIAANGPQSDSWLNDKKLRTKNSSTDPISDLSCGVMAATMVQAINRVRCRRVVDHHGNCSPSTAYLLLSSKAETGSRLLRLLKQAMPNVQIREMKDMIGAPSDRTKPRSDRLICYFLTRKCAGEYLIEDVLVDLNMSRRTLESCIKDLKNASTYLYNRACQIGLSCSSIRGRTGKTVFLLADGTNE